MTDEIIKDRLYLLEHIRLKLDLEAKKTLNDMFEMRVNKEVSSAMYNNCSGIEVAMNVINNIKNDILIDQIRYLREQDLDDCK